MHLCLRCEALHNVSSLDPWLALDLLLFRCEAQQFFRHLHDLHQLLLLLSLCIDWLDARSISSFCRRGLCGILLSREGWFLVWFVWALDTFDYVYNALRDIELDLWRGCHEHRRLRRNQALGVFWPYPEKLLQPLLIVLFDGNRWRFWHMEVSGWCPGWRYWFTEWSGHALRLIFG